MKKKGWRSLVGGWRNQKIQLQSRRIKGTLILLIDVPSKKRKKQEESRCKKQIYRIKTCMNNACLHKGRKKERKKNKQAKQV
jgi:NADP-dependent 3-hydroxy acid dehydrogenase YdfG